ncbi:MAG: family 43 glycosylhydrolase [Halobacteriaceae archaeon]
MVDTLDRRALLASVGAGALGAAGLTGLAAGDDADDHYHNPVGPIGFGDVSVIQADDGTYYAYGTETPKDIVPVARSENLVDWEYVTQALQRNPDWRSDDAGVWAPDINRYDGQYHLYYSYSKWGSNENPGIGLATADSPTGPFEDQGPVFREQDLGMTNAIDPDLNVVDGTPYMIWGSWNGINGIELTAAADDYVEGSAFELAGNHREGPMVVEEGGYYYLFYSTGHCCEGYASTYEVEVGRSESFTGPYVTRDGTDLRDLHAHGSGQTVLTATDRFTGPGHNTAIRDESGDWWMLYHVEATEAREVRTMMLDRIQFEDGWPVVACNGHPSASSPVPSAEFSCDAATFESSVSEATATTTATEAATATDSPTRTRTATATPTATGSESGGVAGPGILGSVAALGAAAAGALYGRRDD